MELEKLKSRWNTMNQAMSDAEIINMRVVKELISHKTRSAYDSIVMQNVQNIVVNLLILFVVFPYVWMNTPISKTSFAIVEVSLTIGLIPLIWKQCILAKINVTDKKCNELSKLVLQYKKICAHETFATILQACLTMVLFYVSELCFNEYYTYEISAKILIVVGLTIITLLTAFFIGLWQRRRHDELMKEIEDGLEDLREFTE